eukprot:Skav233479  [mRNA]  locus=scaffold1310:47865:55549:+ [translate_table: standard]
MGCLLLKVVYGLDPERLYASYFGGDEEPPGAWSRVATAAQLAQQAAPAEAWITRGPGSQRALVAIFARKPRASLWQEGDDSSKPCPCGPCSELHYDRVGGRDAAALVNADDPDVIEIWTALRQGVACSYMLYGIAGSPDIRNLVFMQFFRGDDGQLTNLPSRHIDTGMGLERDQASLPMPSAKSDQFGRGYVLRRILRRAVRYGRSKLDAPPGFFSKLVPKVVETLSPGFPDLTKAAGERVQSILEEEEVAFDRTVDRGMQFFDSLKADLEKEGAKVVPGEQAGLPRLAFLLYDSHGFPLDLTEQMALEAGLSVDVAGFEAQTWALLASMHKWCGK